MKRIAFRCSWLLFLAGFSAWAQAVPAAPASAAAAVDLLGAAAEALIDATSAQVTFVRGEAAAPGLAVAIKPGSEGYPGLVLRPKSKPVWDFSAFGYLEAQVTNTGTGNLAFCLQIENDGDWRKAPWSTETTHLKPGASATARTQFGYCWGKPAYKLNPKAVIRVRVFTSKADVEQSFRVDSLLIGGTPPPKPVRKPRPPRPAVAAAASPVRQNLLTFDAGFDLASVKGNGGSVLPPVNPGMLRVTTPANAFWPGVIIPAPQGKWDLSACEYISLDIHNLDTHETDVFVRVDNPGANGRENCITARTNVQPDQRVTLNIPLKRVSDSPIKLFGMNGYPQGLYPDKVGLDLTHIVALTVFTAATPTANLFEVGNVYAAGRYVEPAWLDMDEDEFFPCVDCFGQFRHKDWPGKVHGDGELQQRRQAEAAAFAADPGPASWDKWGGWAGGPTLNATGHFRVEKYQNKWWLVDPDGKLFFSTGLTCVGSGGGGTPVEERQNWFAELPPNDGPAKAFYSKSYKIWSGYYAGREPLLFDFFTQNLQRKYGDGWRTTYPELVHQRLRRWGLNTLGNWSNGKYAAMQRTPYTMTFYYSSRRLKNEGGGFPDVFDPGFAPALLRGAKQWLTDSAADPWCIGYFLDNEMPWGGETTLARDTLKTKADQPAKRELLRWLQERYPEIAALNAAWQTEFASWDAFAAETKANPRNDAAVKDLTAFNDRIAELYFRSVREAIKTVAPNKLYLGCRCVGGSNNVIAAAIKYCDVVSYNRYCHSLRETRFPGDLDGPMLIGEFHFGALDRGLFSTGLVATDSQEDRGRKYREYVRSALANSQIVGTHWFQYADQAVTGRGDGENAQCGFVDVCDTPYEETIRAARAVGETMYEQRAAKP